MLFFPFAENHSFFIVWILQTVFLMNLKISEISYTLVAPCGVAFFRLSSCTRFAGAEGFHSAFALICIWFFDSQVNSYEKQPRYLRRKFLCKRAYQFTYIHFQFQADLYLGVSPGFSSIHFDS